MGDKDSAIQKLFKDDKKKRLSLHMLVRRHLPPEANTWHQDKILMSLNELTHIRLDRENISEIDSLELLGYKVTNLYLQQNCISGIANIECLKNLQCLTLAGNQIQRVENISKLNKLFLLDLSDNQISTIDIDEFPQSLILLNLSGNPCTKMSDYRGMIIQDLPKLRQLDGVEVSRDEREEAGYQLSSEEEDHEEQEEDDTSLVRPPPMLREHEMDEPFSNLTTGVLLRSQARMEERLVDHRRHNMELDNIRLKYNLPSSVRSPRREALTDDI